MGRKYTFKDLKDLEEYIRSNRDVNFIISYRTYEEYPGMLQTFRFVSDNSGRVLSILVEWENFWDPTGEIGEAREVYSFLSLGEILLFIKHEFSISLENLNLKNKVPDSIPSINYDDKSLSGMYKDAWGRFKKDWKAGKLNLKGKKPDERRSYGF